MGLFDHLDRLCKTISFQKWEQSSNVLIEIPKKSTNLLTLEYQCIEYEEKQKDFKNLLYIAIETFPEKLYFIVSKGIFVRGPHPFKKRNLCF